MIILEIGSEAENQKENLEHASLKTSDPIDMPVPEGISKEDLGSVNKRVVKAKKDSIIKSKRKK